LAIDTKRIFKHFQGMNAEYQKSMDEYKRFLVTAKEKYNDAYIWSYKNSIKEEIMSNKNERVQAAIEEINQIKSELKQKQFKNPYDDLKGPVIRTEDKILIELQRMNNMQMFRTEVEVANSAAELKELYEKYQDDADFHSLFKAEMKKRINSESGLEYQLLEKKLDREPAEFGELTKIESGLKMIANAEMYPSGIEENGLSQVGFQSVFPNEKNFAR
jgi:hypothetical protein